MMLFAWIVRALLLVIVLAVLWHSRKTAWKIVCAVTLLVYLAGSIVRVGRLERVWTDFTGMYRESVEFIVSSAGNYPGITTVALENPPLAFPYAADAVSLLRPEWRTVKIEGGPGEAARYAPCVYMNFNYDGDRVESVDVRALGRK